MDQFTGYFEAEGGFFEMCEIMDPPFDYFNRNKCTEELELHRSRSFIEREISEINSETPDVKTNIYGQRELEEFGGVNGHTGSLQPRRSLHKKTVKFVRNSSSSVFSSSAEIRNSSIRNHPSAPPARYQLKHHQTRRMLHKYSPHQSYQNLCSAEIRNSSIRNHPSAPPARYQLRHHQTPQMMHKYNPHQSYQNLCSNLSAPATEQLQCTLSDTVRKSRYSCRQQFRCITSETKFSKKGVSVRNFPTAPAPYITQLKHNEQTSRYISQLNQKLRNLSEKEKCCKGFDECAGEISLIQNFERRGNSSQDIIEISSDDSYEDTQMNVKNKDSNAFYMSSNSDSSGLEHFCMCSFPKSGEEGGSTYTTGCTSFRHRNMIPLKSDVTLNENTEEHKVKVCLADESQKVLESTVTSSIVSPVSCDPELPRCFTSFDMQEIDTISPLKLAEDTCVEPETSYHSSVDESHEFLDSRVSPHNSSPQSDHPELTRCLATPKIQDVNFISPLKLADNTHDKSEISPSLKEERSVEALKLDVSFSFMEKGGYHPIALPLGCHILEDGSDDSELDEEGTSVLEKRMNKMGRDEYNLNVDTSSSYMPWIVIPLDDVAKVNYKGVNFQNSDDPRCKKEEKPLDFGSVGHKASLLSPSHETEVSLAAFCQESQNVAKANYKLIDEDRMHKQLPISIDVVTDENTNICSRETSEMMQRAQANSEEEVNIFDLSFPDLFLQRNTDSLDFPDIFLDSLSQERVSSGPRKDLPQSDNSSTDTFSQEVFPCKQEIESYMNMDNALKFSDKYLKSLSQENVISGSEKEFPQPVNSDTSICSQEIPLCDQQNETSLNFSESSLEFPETVMNSLLQEKGISEPGIQSSQPDKSSTDIYANVISAHDQRNESSMNVDENLLLEPAILNVCEPENKMNNLIGILATLHKPAVTDNTSDNQNMFRRIDQQQPSISEDMTVKIDESSSRANTKKLPHSTLQLLKESDAFLKGDGLSTRRVRRLRKVSTSLRVEDYALPNSLEEFYVESESCNYAERSGIPVAGKSYENEKPLSCSTQVERFDQKTHLKDNIESVRMVTRSSNRTARIKNSNQDPMVVSKPCRHNYLKSTKKTEKRTSKMETYKDSNNQQSLHGGQSAECKKQYNQQKSRQWEKKSSDAKNRPFLVQFEGRKYKCSEGILTPVSCKDSVSSETCESESGDSDLLFEADCNQNASKTGHNARMRNGVVKKRKVDVRKNSHHEQSAVKKSRSSQSPKVMVQNCLQEIAVSVTKNSQTVTTRKSKKVCIVQKTTRVKKELFPVIDERSRNKTGISQSASSKLQAKGAKAIPAKNDVSGKKKHSVEIQNQSPTSKRKKTEINENTLSADAKVSKSKKGEKSHKEKDKVADKKDQRKLAVKPIIRIHQGLRNTSLKTFKAQQSAKNAKLLAKDKPQKAFPCPLCEKGFKKASQIEKHIKDDHKCSRCDKVLDSKVAKQRHFYSCHATEVHKCVTCQKEYSYPYHLRRHFESQSHKCLIKCLLKEMKKISRGASAIGRTSLKDSNPKQAICPSVTSNDDLVIYDKFSQSRSRKKLKFMEMESNFFDENADLLELIHKIDCVSGENGIVKHFYYKDPELAEIQCCLKEESLSSTSCYEEIEIVKEYSITSHCENFLEDTGHPFAISGSPRSTEHRDSETSISSDLSELDHGWSSSCAANPCKAITTEPLLHDHTRLESNSNSAMSGWFSTAVDVIEQRNLDDDSTYSSYLGLLNNEAGMQLRSVSSSLESFNKSTQECPSGSAKTYQELSSISSAKDLSHLGFIEKGPPNTFSSQVMENINESQNDHLGTQKFSLCRYNSNTLNMQDRTCLLPAENTSQTGIPSNGKVFCPLLIPTSVSGGHETMSWIPPSQTENDTLDAAQSLILLSNPGQDISPELDDLSNTTDSTHKNVEMEWESICSEIQKDVQEYTE